MFDTLSTLGVIGRDGVRSRLEKRRLAGRLDATGLRPGSSADFRVAVYFSDLPVNLYQIRQWYGPLAELARTHPVVVLTRSPATTNLLLDECPLPVFFGPRVTDIESFMATHDIGLVLYVNQNLRNFQMMRFARPAHVFVSHGESDKSYMTSNQLKAYDRVFVAGEAAVARLEGALTDFDVSRRAVQIGRPQGDVHHEAPDLRRDERTSVLYAPTWEGDRPSMHYGSVASHGRRLVESLLADPRYRLVYRPHPRSGAFEPAYARASDAVAALIHEANRSADRPGHLVDLDTAFGWHLEVLDVCISDVSAVALDWLATGKPLLLTRPSDPRVELERTRLVESVPLIAEADASSVASAVDAALSEPDDGRADVIRYYFGETSPGAATRRFVEAADELVTARLGTAPTGPVGPGSDGSGLPEETRDDPASDAADDRDIAAGS